MEVKQKNQLIRFCEHCIHRFNCLGMDLYKCDLQAGTVVCLDYKDEMPPLHIAPVFLHLYREKTKSK